MSRGGRGGGRKRGPDLSWDDEQQPATPPPTKPEEQFPDIDLPVPRPLSSTEISSVHHYLSFRTRVHNGPYYSVLDPSSIADKQTGKFIKRAGFDPFTDQEKYTAKYHKKKRAVPDLRGREYALKHFPPELWPLLDPDRKNPLWKTSDIVIDVETKTSKRKSLKRKREELGLEDDEADDAGKDATSANLDEEGNNTDDPDPIFSGSRRTQTKAAATRRRGDRAREKRGLDAEDDFSEDEEQTPVRPRTKKRKKVSAGDSDNDEDDGDEQDRGDEDDNDDEDGEDGEGEGDEDDEPVDSEFEESDDGGADDYNAENYFDTGEGDDDDGFAFGGGGGGDEGGEYF